MLNEKQTNQTCAHRTLWALTQTHAEIVNFSKENSDYILLVDLSICNFSKLQPMDAEVVYTSIILNFN